MSITEHAVFNDRFKLIDLSGVITAQSFPCGCCQHCLCLPQDEPCVGCGHNVNSPTTPTMSKEKAAVAASSMSFDNIASLIFDIAEALGINLPGKDGVQLFIIKVLGLTRHNKKKADALDNLLNSYDRAKKC